MKIKNYYFNITYLFLEALFWINLKYSYKYLLKWDDDIVVNVPLLLLYTNLNQKPIHYSGYLYFTPKIYRNKSRICYIPPSEYIYSFLPSFIASGLLILSKYTSMKIDYYHRIHQLYIIRDDQYIGILCKILSIKPSSLNKYHRRSKRDNNNYKLKYLITYHADNFYDLKFISNMFNRKKL